MHGGRDTPIPISKPINPTPETHINEETDDKNEDSEDDDKDIYNDNDAVEEVEPPEEDTPDPITIENDEKGSADMKSIYEEE